MALQAIEQIGMDEKLVDDPELETALEDREKRKASLSAVRAEYEAAHDAAMVGIDKLDLGDDTAVRIGRFRVSRKMGKGRIVSFETEAKSRIQIALLDDA